MMMKVCGRDWNVNKSKNWLCFDEFVILKQKKVNKSKNWLCFDEFLIWNVNKSKNWLCFDEFLIWNIYHQPKPDEAVYW